MPKLRENRSIHFSRRELTAFTPNNIGKIRKRLRISHQGPRQTQGENKLIRDKKVSKK